MIDSTPFASSSVFRAGGRLRSAPLGKVRFHANFRWFRNPSHCVGADLCVRAVGGSREGTYPGQHTGRPLQSRLQYPASPVGAGTEPRPYRAIRGAKQRADVPKAWLPPAKFRTEIWGVSHGHRPLRGEGKAQSTALASSAQRSVCGADARDGRRGRQRSPPKVFSNLGQSLSRGKAATAPFAQGSLGLRGTRRTSPGHRSAQQLQAGRDRARPLQKGGEYAEGWGDERPMPVRDLPGCRQLRFPQSGVLGMTTGAKASSSRPTSQRPS